MILAAGVGRRIGSLGQRFPKALLPVLARPVITWQLDALQRLGIHEVVIVVGHLGNRIQAALGDGSDRGLRLIYREQIEPQGIAHALSCAKDALDRPFLLLLGDIFFAPGDLEGLLSRMRQPETQAVLVVRREEDVAKIRRNFTVEMMTEGSHKGWVRRVIEKPKDPTTNLKGTGLYAFSPDFFEAIERTERSPLRNEYELTDAIQIYLDGGAKVGTFETQAPDFNLSEVRDLLDLNVYALRSEGHDEFVDPSAKLGTGVQLMRSIVLSEASVERGTRLEECLVFPGERVSAGNYRRTVFMGGAGLACDPGAE